MNAKRSRPVVSEAAENPVDGRFAFNGTRLIGAAVENQLRATLVQLAAGEIGLHDLTPSLAAFYHLGHFDGVDSLEVRLAQCEADRDRYYLAAFDTPEQLRRRLDQEARDYWEEFLSTAGDGRG